jgi:hypothetical protein
MHIIGEYAGYTEIMSRMQLKAFVASLPGKIIDNIVDAFESGIGTTTLSSNSYTAPFYIPTINPDINTNKNTAFGTGEFNWLAWAGITGADRDGIQYKNAYQVTTLYARILPSDFGLRVPSSSTPQIWKFIFVNDSVLILAERQTNAHNFLPILCGQGTVDGLSYQTKSLASNVVPLQQLGSAFWNSAIATSRRAIMDRTLYDPSRISEKHINSSNPAAKIPVRPAAYGKPVGDAVYQFPFRADNLGDLASMAAQIQTMADKLDRQNPVKRGEFVKGKLAKYDLSEYPKGYFDNGIPKDFINRCMAQTILPPENTTIKYANRAHSRVRITSTVNFYKEKPECEMAGKPRRRIRRTRTHGPIGRFLRFEFRRIA